MDNKLKRYKVFIPIKGYAIYEVEAEDINDAKLAVTQGVNTGSDIEYNEEQNNDEWEVEEDI